MSESSGIKENITPPLTAAQVLARLERLEQHQLATAAAIAPAITGPLGIRILSAPTAGHVLGALPDSPRRTLHPYSY